VTDPEPGPASAPRPAGPSLVERLRGASALCALVFAGLLLGSGIGLAMTYVPSRAEAFDSLLYLRREDGLGAFLRSLHYHLASGAVTAAFLVVILGVVGDFHREWKWEFRLSVIALLLMIGFCFTGYLLPMDQPAYWGTAVRLGIVETVPVAGGLLADMLRGGATFGAATLPRFYALHVAAFPVALVALVLLGFKQALERAARANGPRLIGLCALIALLAAVTALIWPAPLEPRAAPADTEYVPRPEWYFLWLFQFGKYVHGFEWVESAFLPGASLLICMALPELRISARARRFGVIGILAVMFGLSGLALFEDRDLPRKPEYEEGLVLKATSNYATECAGCHGPGGRGNGPDAAKLDTIPADFTRSVFWTEDTLKDIVQVTTIGEAPDMPAFGSRLSAEEILAIANYIESNFRPRRSSAAGGKEQESP